MGESENALNITESRLIANYMQIEEVKVFYESYGYLETSYRTSYLSFSTLAYGTPGKSLAVLLEENKFKTSWDWLMPVIEKILKTEKFEDGSPVGLRTFGEISDKGLFMVRFERCSLHQSDSFLKASYYAVIDYLKQ